MPMSSALRLHLLNEFRLTIDEKPVNDLHQARLQSLLAYLALHADAPQPRRQIAVHFWLDSSEKQARTNLRKLLHRLQQQLPQIDQWLDLGPQALGWQPNATVTSDIAELFQALDQLEAALNRAAQLDPTHVEAVMRAYPGELLPSCYDEWLLDQRDALHDRVLHVLQSALPHLEQNQAYRVGIHCARFLLRLEPDAEAVYRCLMRLHTLDGDRAAALRVYHTCVQQLEEHLGVPPSPETETLYAYLQQHDQPKNLPATASATENATANTHLPSPITDHAPSHPLIGRQAEWQTLQTAWRTAQRRTPHFCLVWGEAGMGKTHLAEALQHWVSSRPSTIAMARAYAAEGNLPYAPVTTWLRAPGIRPTLDTLASHWQTEIARLLPELEQADPTLPPPQPMDESWQHQRFHEALATALAQASGPRLLILDDIQWCDVETLRWLRYLLRFDPHLPLLVLGTARSDAVITGHPLLDLVHELQRAHQITQIELGPLAPQASVELIHHLSGDTALPRADQLAAEAEGNPLFIVEMVRAQLAAPADHTPRSGGKVGDTPTAAISVHPAPPLPATVQAVIATRLANLSAAAHKVADVAAAIGRTFDPALLRATDLLATDELITGLDELWARRILREEAGAYEFSHDKIREVAYAALPPMQRRQLHRRIARALEHLHAADPTPVWDQLAHHHALAHEPQAARPYLIRLAERADALDAVSDAAAYYTQALTLHTGSIAADPAAAFDLHARRAALLERAGELATVAQDVTAMLNLAQQLDDPTRQAQAYLRQAAYLSRQGKPIEAIPVAEQALARYRAQDDLAGEIQALRELGLICWSAQNYGGALRYGRTVLQRHHHQGDVAGEATALHNLAEIYRSLESPRQAIALYEQARQLYWGSQNQRGEAVTLYGLAETYRQLAKPDQALAAYRQAETSCEQAGEWVIRSRVYHAMGILYWEMDRPDAALDALRQAVATSDTIGHLPGAAYSRLAQGFIAAHTGARQAAIDLLQGAHAIFQRMNDAEGAREVQMRLDLLQRNCLDLPEPPASLHWLRSHVVLTDWKVYCEFELPHLAARPDHAAAD